MRKFTKRQRNKVYKKVLDNYNPNVYAEGLCCQINRNINRKKITHIDSQLTQKVFCELGLFEHDLIWTGLFWQTHEDEERFLALCFMIEMTK